MMRVLLAAALAMPAVVGGSPAAAQPAESAALPVLHPVPHHVQRTGADLPAPDEVAVRFGARVDEPTRDALTAALEEAGVRVGPEGFPIRVEVAGTGPAEGYRLRVGRDGALLRGNDVTGAFYAVQTFSQLLGAPLPQLSIVDAPDVPVRGIVEGFRGTPWTHQARVDNLKLAGRFKLNNYVHAPKDDPYLREQWRTPYPADRLTGLADLVDLAVANHVTVTHAISPGASICYSDPADVRALIAKMDAVYDVGVRSFAVLLDEASLTTWHCDADRDRYGEPSERTVGRAHADLLNAVRRQFVTERRGVEPLRTLPTEHGDIADSPYKKSMRDELDPAVVLMWTGVGTVAPEITVRQAATAERVWGRKTFVWDNYPVNDYDEATGRVLQAPYTGREPGLPVRGVAVNLMPQAYAGHIAMITAVDRNWNDTGYAPYRSWLTVTGMFGGPVVPELRALADTQFASPLAPSHWAPRAPQLAGRLAALRTGYAGTAEEKHAAVAEFRPYQRMLATMTGPITENIPELSVDMKPWLDALTLWGQALGRTLDGLDARADGDTAAAEQAFAESASLAQRAAEIQTIPGVTPVRGPVKVADGVLDVFLRDAPEW